MLEVYRDEHRYELDGHELRSVTDSLKSAGLVWYPDDPEARLRGTHVHEATRLDDLNDLDESSVEQYMGYVEGWRLFKQETGFVPDVKRMEEVVHNSQAAGRFDVIGSFPKQALKFICDKKTGDVAAATAIQLAGYADLLGGAWGRVAVGLPGDGTYRCKIFPVSELWNDIFVWRAALKISEWRARNR